MFTPYGIRERASVIVRQRGVIKKIELQLALDANFPDADAKLIGDIVEDMIQERLFTVIIGGSHVLLLPLNTTLVISK